MAEFFVLKYCFRPLILTILFCLHCYYLSTNKHNVNTELNHIIEQQQQQYWHKQFITQQYALLSRVRELGLLEKTAELGILSKLEKQGLTLEKAEELLPLLEDAGVLSLVANNQQLLINGVAPIAVEGAPLLLPVVAGALDIGAPAFFLGAAGAAGLDLALWNSGAEVPFIGLPAGGVLGLVLIPLSVVLAVVGAALGSLKK